MTALEPLQICASGLCDQAQGQCDVCIASTRKCSDNRVVVCSADGQTASMLDCPSALPTCVGNGNCVQCGVGSDCPSGVCVSNLCMDCDATHPCKGAHQQCNSVHQCVPQPYCGDGNVNSGEECDPAASGESAWTCNAACRKTTAYTWCPGTKTPDGQSVGCSAGEQCLGGFGCSKQCTSVADCGSVSQGGATAECTAIGVCAIGCGSSLGCPAGLVCAQTVEWGRICNLCNAAGADPCPSGLTCKKQSADQYFKCLP
jgi:hypothetical protein